MTQEEYLKRTLAAIQEYCRTHTAEEKLQHLVDAGIIDQEGNVLMGDERPKPAPPAANGAPPVTK